MSDWLHQTRPNVRQAPAPISIKFRDIDCDYRTTAKNNALLIDNDAAIRNQIRNLLSTPTGTEDFEPGYGSDLPYRIMEPISSVTAFFIEQDIILSINNWMRNIIRIVVPGATVTPLPSEDGYHIDLPYIRNYDSKSSTYAFDVLR